MKRIVAIVMAGILAVMMLSGCGPTETSNLTKVTIWDGENNYKGFYREKVEEFNKTIGKEMGIEVEYLIRSDVSKETQLAFTSNQAPDIIGGSNTATLMQTLAGAGHIAAYEDIEGGVEFLKKYKDFIIPDNNQGSHDGKTYSLPHSMSTRALVYNKDMFIAAGLVDENGEPTPPKTVDEYVEFAKKLTNPEKNQYGVIYNGKDDWYSTNIGLFVDGSRGYRTGYNPYTGKYEMDVQAKVMEKCVQIKKDGSYLPGMEGLNNDSARAKFANGNIGMKWTADFDYAVYTSQFPITTFEWGVAPLPVLDFDGEYLGQQATYNAGWLMNKESVERLGADVMLAIMGYFYSDEFMIERFKAGYAIPYSYDLVRDVKVDDDMEQWKSFAEMVAFSRKGAIYKSPQKDTTGIKRMADFWKEVWAGEASVDEIKPFCDYYVDEYNKGVQKYMAAHPDYVLPDTLPADYDMCDIEDYPELIEKYGYEGLLK